MGSKMRRKLRDACGRSGSGGRGVVHGGGAEKAGRQLQEAPAAIACGSNQAINKEGQMAHAFIDPRAGTVCYARP